MQEGAALIVNARSRTGKAAFQKALDLFGSIGVEVGASHALSDPARLAETVRHAASQGHDPIIIGNACSSRHARAFDLWEALTTLIFSRSRSITLSSALIDSWLS